MPFPPALLAEAAAAGRTAGVPGDRPLVAIETGRRPHTFADATGWLAGEGYYVFDLSASPPRTGLLELSVLLASRFLVCESLELQQLAYFTNTPSLLVNARDPFSAYPVRRDGLFSLATAIDLDSGRMLAGGDLLGESYFRNRRNYGFRSNGAAEVLTSVREMHGAVTQGFDESISQTAFRERVVAAGTMLAAHVPFVAEWGPDAGFIGDGRLVQWQADRLGSEARSATAASDRAQ